MECKQAKILLAPHILGDLDDDPQRCRELQVHLLSCPDCAEMYEGFQEVIGFVRNHKAEFAQAFENVRAREQQGLVLARSVSSEPVEATEKSKRFRLFLRIGAVAACLVLGILTWMASTNNSKQQSLSRNVASSQITTAPKSFLKVEVVEPTGNITIDTSQAIIADNELKTLLINSKHQMIMNVGTVLSIEPTMKHSNIGCLVKLDSGQIHTHVQHDGNPFIVDTVNGQAVITGTTFDVKATKDSTTLVVSEGTVRFENENGSVNVKAGQKSMLTANGKPTSPALCDVKVFTAWATGDKGIPDLAIAKPLSSKESDYEWPWPVEREAVALEDVDSEDWFKEKQSWFISEFPWIFQLQKALSKEGVEVGYDELLIQSDDLWRFSYRQSQPSRVSVLSFDTLLKVSSNYGFDQQWLLENVTAAKYALINFTLTDETLDLLNAFKQWDNIFKTSQQSPDTVDYDILEHLFRASIYTANTRSLLWFAIKNGNYLLTDKEQSEVLTMLQQQVNAAIMCQENVLYQPNKEKQLCDTASWPQDKWYKWTIVISENIEEIIDTEDKISKYEICK